LSIYIDVDETLSCAAAAVGVCGFGMHLCRGNSGGGLAGIGWLTNMVAEKVFGKLKLNFLLSLSTISPRGWRVSSPLRSIRQTTRLSYSDLVVDQNRGT